VTDEVGQQGGLVAQVTEQKHAVAVAHLEHLAQRYRLVAAAAHMAENHVVPVAAGFGGDGGDGHAEEGVADVPDDQPQQAGAGATQGARERIGRVTVLGDHLQDAGAGLGGNWHA
jgi:uncharacterized spore protein YtfJ